MVTRLFPGICFGTTTAIALILLGCGPPSGAGRPVQRISTTAADPDRQAWAADRENVVRQRRIAASGPQRYPAEETPPWLAELLHAPDPSVRIEGLNLWAQHPGSSLDPLTYALVDSDESVRARAQELVEQELARR